MFLVISDFIYSTSFHPVFTGNSKTTDMMPEVDPTVEGAINSIMVNQTFFHNTILKTAITWTLKPGQQKFDVRLWKGKA